MLRHDRATLRTLPLRRQVAALFASDLRAAIMSLIETALVDDDFHDPRVAADGGFNAWGDHVGHTAALAAVNQSTLAAIVPVHHTAAEIRDGDGTVLIAGFLRWAGRHGVRAIGGLPTGFIDSPIAEDSLAAIRTIYRDQGADFLELPNHSCYPRADFFDTQDHLNEEAQIKHSVAVGEALVRLMDPTAAIGSRPAAHGPDAHGPETGTVAVTGQLCCCLSSQRVLACATASAGELPQATSQTDSVPDIQQAAPMSENLSDEQRDAISEVLSMFGSRSNPRAMSANTHDFGSPARDMHMSSARDATRVGTSGGQGMRLSTGVSVSAEAIRMRAANRSLFAVSAIR